VAQSHAGARCYKRCNDPVGRSPGQWLKGHTSDADAQETRVTVAAWTTPP